MVALAGLWLTFAWQTPPSAIPNASISLIDYTNITLIARDPKIGVYPDPGNWIRARVYLTNEGNESISYYAWGNEPFGDVDVQTEKGSTNGYMAPHFTGGSTLLRPASAAKFWVIIPTNAQQWQCTFEVETSSMRERTIWRLIDGKYPRKILESLPESVSEKMTYPLRWLPDKSGPATVIKSPLFKITNDVAPRP